MIAIAMLISAVVTLVRAESHTVTLTSLCLDGTPQFQTSSSASGPVIPSESPNTGGYSVAWVSDGSLAGIAYLSTEPNGAIDEWSRCGASGENCAFVSVTLDDSKSPPAYASINIPTGHYLGDITYQFTGGKNGNCDTITGSCPNENCNVHNPCDDNDVNLEITFCAVQT